MTSRILGRAGILFLAVYFLNACSKNSDSGASALNGGETCSTSGTAISGDPTQSGTPLQISNFTVSIIGAGAGPFSITVAGNAPVSASTPTYSFPGTIQANANDTVSVTDSSNGANLTCPVSASGGTGVNNGTNGYPNTAGYPSTNGGTYPNTGYPYSNGGSYPTGYNQTPVYGNGNGSAISCYLTIWPSTTAYVNSIVYIYVTASTGEQLYITGWNPGEPWSIQPSFPRPNPLAIRYNQSGPKYMQITAQSSSRPGVYCNALQGMVNIY